MKKTKKLKKPTSTQLTKKLDQAIRDLFKKMYGDNPECICCGKKDAWFHPTKAKYGIQVGHYVSRTRTCLRWDLNNLYPQCSSDNVKHNQNPSVMTMAIIKKHGKERIEYLEKTSREGVGIRITVQQKQELLNELLDKINSLS